MAQMRCFLVVIFPVVFDAVPTCDLSLTAFVIRKEYAHGARSAKRSRKMFPEGSRSCASHPIISSLPVVSGCYQSASVHALLS